MHQEFEGAKDSGITFDVYHLFYFNKEKDKWTQVGVQYKGEVHKVFGPNMIVYIVLKLNKDGVNGIKLEKVGECKNDNTTSFL